MNFVGKHNYYRIARKIINKGKEKKNYIGGILK